MNIKDLLREDDAVSPVIGVILMVAITVILAAVIGTFVLGLGDQVQNSAPNANFQFEYETVTYDIGDGTNAQDVDALTATIQHNGGQDVDASNVGILVDGNPAYGLDDSASDPAPGAPTEPFASGTISTGSSTEIAFYNTGSAEATTGSNNIEGDGSGNLQSQEGSVTANELTGGETVRVVWTSPNGDSSNTIGESTVPS